MPVSGNLTVGIGVLSYTEQLNISVIADRDLPALTTGLNGSLSDLTSAATSATKPSHNSTATQLTPPAY